jgi:lysophospholipase L1-like esterase
MSARVLVLGDSIAGGLGARGRPFPRLVAEALGEPPMLDLSKSSRLIDESLSMAEQIAAFAPTLAIVQHGAAESIVHPGPLANGLIDRFAPPGWHGVEGLQPRPYYCSDARKRRHQRRVSSLKLAIKRLVIASSGGRSRMTPEMFERHLGELIAMLHAHDCDVVVLGMWRWDERLHPRSRAAVDGTDAAIRRVVEADPRVAFVDVEATLRCWEDYLDDRMHWNDEGHVRVAAAIVATVAPLLAAAPARQRRRPAA